MISCARRNPPRFMRPGDVAEVETGGVGVLRTPVVAEAAWTAVAVRTLGRVDGAARLRR
jgi:hypothetical protein